MKKNEYKRKILFINPRFQTRFIAFMLSIFAISAIALYSTVWYFFWRLKDLGVKFNIPLDHPFFVFITQQQTLMAQIMVITVVVMFVLIIGYGLVFSHRIAGSIYRLNKEMREIQSVDNYPGLKFRKNDFFPELAKEFTQMIQKFGDKTPKDKP